MYGMGPAQYFRSKFCLVDITCTIIDVVAVAAELAAASAVQQEGNTGSGATNTMEFAPLLRALRILRFMRLMRVLRLARVVTTFKKALSDNLETDKDGWRLTRYGLHRLTKLFSGVEGEALDLDKMSKTPIVTVLLDLLMYEDAELFEIAFGTLSRHFSQVTEFISTMKNVQLLATPESSSAYDLLRAELSVFRNHIEAYEIWGCKNDFSETSSLDTVHEVLRTLHKLAALCEEKMNASAIDNNQQEL